MDLLAMLLVGLISSLLVVYLVNYAPIKSTIFGRSWSPRLLVCKLLIPADIIMTTTMIVIPMLFGVSGIMAFVAGTFTAAGLSAGVVLVRKFFEPRWRRQFEELKDKEFVISGEEIAC